MDEVEAAGSSPEAVRLTAEWHGPATRNQWGTTSSKPEILTGMALCYDTDAHSARGPQPTSRHALAIITWRVKTVLVAHDCIEDPKGIGCPGTLER